MTLTQMNYIITISETGSLNKAMHQIVDGEVNIEYMYANKYVCVGILIIFMEHKKSRILD